MIYPITILALDPGRRSGWAVFASGELQDSGEVTTAEERAAVLTEWADDLHIVVREAWPPHHKSTHQTLIGMGANWGRWAEQLDLVGFHHRRIYRVHPRTWRAGIIGMTKRYREQWKQAAIDRVRHLYGVVCGDDQAEAICIGEWAAKSADVWESLPKRERKRLERLVA